MRFLRLLTVRRPSASFRSCSSRVRNVGIMAHIDAGKTTTTERMLFYSGFMRNIGEVHHGDTVMDYMSQERDRGITITSAAITFPWRNHQVNLIDTPGHVDFTIEVERSLRVLDGGIIVLDGSAGVEAQTQTVWRQAERNAVPRIAFINKMDKHNADFEMSVRSIEKKLNVKPVVAQVPVGEGKSFRGVVDLVRMRTMVWAADGSLGRSFETAQVSADDCVVAARAELIDHLSGLDDDIAEYLIEHEDYLGVSTEMVEKAIRNMVLKDRGSLLTLCGSAYKNIAVQPLMDALLAYLPAPGDIHHAFLKHYGQGFCGMAFKIIHHPQKGALTFIRVYSGSIKDGGSFYNVNRGRSEKIQRLMVAFADDFRVVREVTAGNIAVVSGVRDIVTGDTLVESRAMAKDADILAGVSVPDPVFFCSIEPPSLSQQKQLDLALTNLSREDPSLRVRSDVDTGQVVLGGMGELHLEVIQDRIKKEYKVDADLGPLMVAYKETVMSAAEKAIEFERQVLDQKHKAQVRISVDPEKGEPKPKLVVEKEVLDQLRPWQRKAVLKGFDDAVSVGPILGFPLVHAAFRIREVTAERGTSDTMIAAAVAEAVKAVVGAAGPRLMEPFMRLDITVDDVGMGSSIVQDIVRRRGHVGEAGAKRVEAVAPLADLRGYAKHLRTVTSGKAFFGMEFSHYEVMEEYAQNKAVEEVTGFAPM